MCAMKVVDDSSRASAANARSWYAATGALCTSGTSSRVNTPRPTPSGSRRLCTARLSDASRSQKVARTRSGAADRPNSRHISGLLDLLDVLLNVAAQRPPGGSRVAVQMFGDGRMVTGVVTSAKRVQPQPGRYERQSQQRLPPSDEQQLGD